MGAECASLNNSVPILVTAWLWHVLCYSKGMPRGIVGSIRLSYG